MDQRNVYTLALCGLVSLGLLAGCQSASTEVAVSQGPGTFPPATQETETLPTARQEETAPADAPTSSAQSAAADHIEELFAALEAGEAPSQRADEEGETTQTMLTGEELKGFTQWLWGQSEAGALDDGVSLTSAICIEGGCRRDGTIWLTAWEGAASFYFVDLRETTSGYEILSLEGWGC